MTPLIHTVVAAETGAPREGGGASDLQDEIDRQLLKRAFDIGGAILRGGIYQIAKFHDRNPEQPYDVIEVPNAYTNAGGALWLDLLAGAGGQAYDAAHSYIGVGDSTTAFAATQTDLQAITNVLRVAMDATFPSRTGQVLTFRSTFGSGQANFAWQEAGLFNNATTGTMLSRIVQNLGTKASGSWQISYTITLP